MTEGAYMWMQDGLKMPNKLLEASKSYRTEMDVIEQFIAEKCVRDEKGKSSGKELYDAYKIWADDNNEYKMDKNKFGKKLKDKFESRRYNDGIKYIGIRLIQTYPGLYSLS